jgi:archaellum biogenesis ATPase FlaH
MTYASGQQTRPRPPHADPSENGQQDDPGRLHELDIAHLLSQPPPEHQWIWDGYIERRTLTVLHGDGGTGKSILAGHLARAVTTGGTCLGRPTAQSSALIIDAENPLDEISRRLHALDYASIPTGQIAYYRASDVILGTTGTGPELDRLADVVTVHEAGFVILDSQRGLWGGEEKDAIEIRPLYRQLQHLAEQTDCAIVVIHHDRRIGGFSGSGDIHNSADTRLHLERPDPDKPERILRHAKARSSAELQPAAYTFTFDETIGLFTFTQPREPITDAGMVRQALEDDWLTVTEIAERAGIRRVDTQPILWELVRNREAQHMQGPPGRKKTAKCFRSMTVSPNLSQTRDNMGQEDQNVPPAYLSPVGPPYGVGGPPDKSDTPDLSQTSDSQLLIPDDDIPF